MSSFWLHLSTLTCAPHIQLCIYLHIHEINPFQRIQDRAYIHVPGNLWISESHDSSDYLSVGISGFSRFSFILFLCHAKNCSDSVLAPISTTPRQQGFSLFAYVILALFFEVGSTVLEYRKAHGVGSVQDVAATRFRPTLMLQVGIVQTSAALPVFSSIQISWRTSALCGPGVLQGVSAVW